MQDKIQYALSLLDRVQFAVRDLDNSREKSIVITHLETAELWLERLQKYEEAKKHESYHAGTSCRSVQGNRVVKQ